MKKDWLRTSLIAGIAFVCFLLVIRWNDATQIEHASTDEDTTISSQTAVTSVPSAQGMQVEEQTAETPSQDYNSEHLPEINAPKTVIPKRVATKEYIHVKTDVLEVLINPIGGDLDKIALPTFYEKIDTPDKPYILLNNTSKHTYIAQSALIGQNGTHTNKGRSIFSSDKKEYVLKDSEDELTVDLFLQQTPSLSIIKRFHFKRDDHLINISYIVNNQSDSIWQAKMYGRIKHDGYNSIESAGLGMQPFFGASTTTTETNYEKMSFDDIAEETFEHTKTGGWVSMVQHYFFSAWVPKQDDKNEFKLFKDKNVFVLQFKGQNVDIAPGSTGEISAGFYAGPKNIKRLEKISPYLDLTVDYSFLWWIAKPLFYVLDTIHGFVGNWGVAIILLTLCIKILFFYPSAASFRSMAKMRKLQPKMKDLKDRFGDDRQKFSAETMKLYKQEKVNPLSGCMPILIQMPVFLALYWVLMESVELRHAPFMLWINDLSVKDPLFILPLIYGGSMWIQQKLNPTPPDPMQAKVMQMMPIFFTFLFLFFPAGLVLYWVVNNTLSITQQYFITKHIESQD